MQVGLIFPFRAQVFRLDVAETKATGGYDSTFGETRVHRDAGGKRVTARKEMAPILVRAQIEDQTFDTLNALNAGQSPERTVQLVAHMRWLEQNNLIDPATGLARFRVGDRLGAIYTDREVLVHTITDPPGLYCTEVRPISYGLGGKLNLLLLAFQARAQATNG